LKVLGIKTDSEIRYQLGFVDPICKLKGILLNKNGDTTIGKLKSSHMS
jgi:hypothetical protein